MSAKAPNREIDQTATAAHKNNLPAVDFEITEACDCFCGCGTTRHLYLNPEEAHYVVENCCGKTETRRPYGELGSVDEVNNCGLCYGWSSGILGTTPQGGAVGNFPGCCGIHRLHIMSFRSLSYFKFQTMSHQN